MVRFISPPTRPKNGHEVNREYEETTSAYRGSKSRHPWRGNPTGEEIPLAIAALQHQSPLVPISLLDMIEIIASELRSTWDDYQRLMATLENACKTQPAGSILSMDQKKPLEDVMDDIIGFAHCFGFDEVAEAATRVREQVDCSGTIRYADCTIGVVFDMMQDLNSVLGSAISKKKLVFLEDDKEKFLNRSDLFDRLVY